MAASVAMAAPAPSGAPADQPGAQPSVDKQLLDKLNADLKDDVDRELFAPDDKESGLGQERPGDAPTPDEREKLQRQLSRELGAAGESEDENPLLGIAQGMQQAQQRIGQTDAGPETQKVQKQVVADLDKLLQQARKRCQGACSSKCNPQQTASRSGVPQPGQKPGGGKPGSKPATTSNAQPGQGEARRPDPAQVRELLRAIWGELPEHEREQMLQLPIEEFLPKYELLIEEYFRRLAEEQGK